MNFQMFKLVLEKAEEPEIKLPASAGSWKKQESSRKIRDAGAEGKVPALEAHRGVTLGPRRTESQGSG